MHGARKPKTTIAHAVANLTTVITVGAERHRYSVEHRIYFTGATGNSSPTTKSASLVLATAFSSFALLSY